MNSMNKCGLSTVVICRLICLLAIVLMQAFSTAGYSQTTTNLTIQVQNKTVKEILIIIEKRANVYFFYKDQDVDLSRKVILNLKNQTLSKVLDELFKNSSTTFKIDAKQVYLSKRAEPAEKSKPSTDKKKITGSVRDSKGEPIIGASVYVKGTSVGVPTDLNGEFIMDRPTGGVIHVSYVGFQTKEVVLGAQTLLDVVLESDAKTIDDVVVVAYGVQKKETVTGAISSVQTKDIKKSSSANLENALAGRISGLSIVQSSGQPGKDNAMIHLRGASTTNSSNPLVLIDGVPRDNMGVMDPNEIASISVLKDASATAVFGVRGANGVIMITTKRGEIGKMQLSVNVETSLQSFTREPQELNSWDYMRLKNEAALNDKLPKIYTENWIAKYENKTKSALEKYMYPSHFYYGEMMRQFAPQTRASLNISGGTDRMQYFVNAAYVHQGGQFKTESKDKLGYDPQVRLDRYNFRANVDYKLAKNLKAYLNLSSYLEKVGMPSTSNYGGDDNEMMGNIFRSLQYSRPFEIGPTTTKVDGSSVPAGEVIKFDNLLRTGFEIVNRSGYRNDTRMSFNGSYGMEWDLSFITKGLTMKGMVSFDNKSATVMDAHVSPQQYLVRLVNSSAGTKPVFSTNMGKGSMFISKAANYQYNVNLQGSLNYARTFDEKHKVSGLLLAQRDYWESTVGEIPYNVLGLSARATYSFDDRYLAEVNAGYNGSEQFSRNKRFGFFPAASLGWIVSNEEFFKPLTSVVTVLKLRGSYGEVGNDKLGGARFLYMDDMYFKDKNSNGGYGEFFLGSLSNGYYIDEGMVGNPDLTWEVARKQNYGIDLQLFNDLNISFDYFTEKRDKILITRSMVPGLQGVDLNNVPKANMGKVNNHGFEVEINYSKYINEDLIIGVRGNFSFNKNKVIYMDEPQLPDDYVYRYRQTGFPLGTTFGYKIDYSNGGNGFFNTQEEIDGYVDKSGDKISYDFGNFGLGDFKYVDQNGDGVVNEKDKVPLGNTLVPEISYGVSFDLSYKWFDFSILFQGLGRTSMFYSNEGVFETLYSGNYFDYHRTAWTKERYEKGDNITYPALHLTSGTNHTVNDFFVMDRSFTRLKNVELGFNFPKKWTDYMGINNVRLYVSGQNLITWDNLKMTTIDPEQFSASANLSGIVYPVTKMFNVGLNITF